MAPRSMPLKLSQWAFRKVPQDSCRLRSGAGSMPCAFKMLATVLEQTRCPTLSSALGSADSPN